MKYRTALFLVALLVLLGHEPQAQRVAATTHRAYGERGGVLHDRPTYHSSRVWVPGQYVTDYEREWVPARSARVWKDPVYEIRVDSCGNRFRVLVCPGSWQTIQIPGRYERRRVYVWRPGHWVARGSCT